MKITIHKKYIVIIIILFSITYLYACSSIEITNEKTSGEKLVGPSIVPTVVPSQDNIPLITNTTSPLISGVGNKVPILYYHCISDNIFGIDELFVSPSEFDKQMNYLHENNFNIITFDDLQNVGNIDNPIIITFDDGYENNFTDAYPILKKYNYKATIFLTVNSINKKNYLKEDQIKSMIDLINFQSHTLTHPDLRTLNSAKIEYELSESIKIIKKLTNQESNTFAYPTGYYNETVLQITQKYFDYAVTNIGGLYYNDIDNYEIKRVYVPRNLTLDNFKEKIKVGTS